MIVTGARDTYAAFGKQVVGDFTGAGNFTYWLVALGAVGAIGYVPSLRSFSRAFMALIIVAMVIRNGGVFDKLTQALQNGPVHPGDNAVDITPGAGTSNAAGTAASQSNDALVQSLVSRGSTDAQNNFKTAVSVFEAVAPLF
jgi:hypothetical protein